MGSRGIRRLVLGILLLLVGVGIYARFLRPPVAEVMVYTVQTGLVEETVTNARSGTLRSRRRAVLAPEVAGQVATLHVREGQRVAPGEILLELEDAAARAALHLAQRALEVAQAAAREACIAADLALRERTRQEDLFRKGLASQAVRDRAVNEARVAQARCEAAQAEARRAEAAVEQAQVHLEQTRLRAPFGGMVTRLDVDVGEWIGPGMGSTPGGGVVELMDPDHLYVEAPIDEVDAGRLRPGLPVRVTLATHPDQVFSGTLVRIAPYVEAIRGESRTVQVEVGLDPLPSEVLLLPGTTADVEIVLDAREQVPRIPTFAVMEGDQVLVVEGGTLVARKIQIGLRNWNYVEVREGLRPGEKIAVNLEQSGVRAGVRVRVVGEVGS